MHLDFFQALLRLVPSPVTLTGRRVKQELALHELASQLQGRPVSLENFRSICDRPERRVDKMSLIITAECINCGACEPECPNNAIYEPNAEWAFSDGTTLKGQIEYHGETIDAGKKLDPLSDSIYFIVPDKCTECAGFHDEPQCVAVCPVDCCVDDPEHREPQEELLTRKERLHA